MRAITTDSTDVKKTIGNTANDSMPINSTTYMKKINLLKGTNYQGSFKNK